MKKYGVGTLWYGAFATAAATFVGHYPVRPLFFCHIRLPLTRRLRVGFGYLIGPVIGSGIWRMTHRRLMRLIEKRDKEFHQHIVKNRVDPTAQSATNPVPDYYG